MARNVTLKLDEALLKKCRALAVEEDKSLSQWVAELIAKNIMRRSDWNRAKKQALKRLENPFTLGGKRLSRDDLHEG